MPDIAEAEIELLQEAAGPRRVRNEVPIPMQRMEWDNAEMVQGIFVEPGVFAQEYVSIGIPTAKQGKRTTLRDFVNIATTGLFGVELEVEGKKIKAPVDGAWKGAKDGSLRGESLEYILKKPLSYDKTLEAFSELRNWFVYCQSTLIPSFRTSLHVHVNMLDLTKEQIVSFIYLSHLVEDVLVRYCGETRIGNRFCLRTRDAEWKVKQLKYWISQSDYRGRLRQETLKYSAINIATLSSYGSIEFRSMRATVDENELIPWLSVLQNLYDIAIIVPVKEIEEIARNKPEEIINVVFKEHLPKFEYEGMVDDVRMAHSLLIEIPYTKVG